MVTRKQLIDSIQANVENKDVNLSSLTLRERSRFFRLSDRIHRGLYQYLTDQELEEFERLSCIAYGEPGPDRSHIYRGAISGPSETR